ncbi:hypothetical protein JR316_0003152 [Psilocybe cubensis]|uniref:Uncharacterized protein n=2 Tax=Psilocybe cubensis TaxID=181762 RepID=A0ACB8H7M4_PSICU|nr:hypothetical protein JR316_0003152 [Psilocybe cubensis]KAH9483682.1 hypothetical protein JR316_0003152 [Psilocybe cubensis]
MLARVQNENAHADRRRERDDRRRSQAQQQQQQVPGAGAGPGQQGGNVVPPSPALVRHGSRQRKVPAALTPGGAMAGVQGNIPIGGTLQPQRNSQMHMQQQLQQGQHPYAGPGIGVGYEYAQQQQQLQQAQQQQYGRTSPMVTASVGAGAPVAAVSHVRAMGGDVGVAQDYQGQQGQGQQMHDEDVQKPSFLKLLTCRC